ncbi:MAG: phenylalanine--tRNA ligase subunit alpha [Gammaproteobacteria bacterium]|nr:phenylalanine--tRNA ligase subunit alpha [Gammaproteobacteria bacterium]MYF67262.1 phenylalanine--tRNA ligase subunit alpha [Gammaproteobacteria bacterium]MYK36695.1 phenylalanine--tRNA ligase subunit alpha [Gammaproteobacteria bacterium]
MGDLQDRAREALAEIESAATPEALEELRVRLLGRKGEITAQLKALGSLPPQERPAAGKAVNEAKNAISAAIAGRKRALSERRLDEELSEGGIDVTLPGRGIPPGARHPVTRTIRRMRDILTGAGFSARSGPEVEDEFHNFTALNMPENHPARAMHDTFYLPSGMLLRTHTSPVQIRSMLAEGAPLKIISLGRVFRRDSDQTHTPVFHQVEGLAVDEGVSLANLKSLLHEFAERFFERKVEVRFRASYFPFTEPSAEMDVRWGDGGWLEILGCGMVHPEVLRHGGVDPERYTGYAFGMGVERMAMLRYGVKDIRRFFENDIRFLGQFAP